MRPSLRIGLLATVLLFGRHVEAAPKAPPPSWPGGVTFCTSEVDIRAAWPAAREVADGVLEVQIRHFDVDGFASVVFEEEKVIAIRFRALQKAEKYLDDASVQKLRAGAEALIGVAGTHDPGRKRWTWSTAAVPEAALKTSSSTIYFEGIVDIKDCGGGGRTMGGTTEQEQKDLDASSRKRAVDFDPMAEDIEDEERKAEEEKQKKKESDKKAKEERAKDDSALKDKDIDW